MPRLSSNDLAALLACVRNLYARRTPAALSQHLCGAIRRLVPAENSTYSELDPRKQYRAAVELMDPPELLTPKVAAVFRRHMAEHPLIAYYARSGDGRARKISDFLTTRQLHRLALYNDYVRPFFGAQYQIAIATTAMPDRIVGMSLARSRRDFSERDRLLLDLLRPHIVQARRTSEAIARLSADLVSFERGLDAAAVGLVVVGPAWTVRTMTTRAACWLRQYCGRMRSSGQLPDIVQRWMQRQDDGRAASSDVPLPHRPLVLARDGHELTIRMVPENEGYLLLLKDRRTVVDRVALGALDLTPREADVLVWVAAGKTNMETATIIGGRPRTVEKHLERIFRKLGVENRTAAATFVKDALIDKPD